MHPATDFPRIKNRLRGVSITRGKIIAAVLDLVSPASTIQAATIEYLALM